MEQQDVDFIKSLTHTTDTTFQHVIKPHRKAFFAWSRMLGVLIAFVLFVGIAYSTKAIMSGGALSQQFGNASMIEQIKHLVGANDRPLAGEDVDRINILILGIGGAEHEGGELTDTIILASIKPSTKSVGMLSIPRDLVAPIEGVGWQKINSANAYGKAFTPNEQGSGPRLAAQTIETITGLTIDYYIKVDFSGFVQVVDALGGLDIEVPNTFTDYQYPDDNYGFEPLHFDAGETHLTGDMALKYARSRHGTNQEGSDFARARRQQQIIKALQEKALGLSTFLNPNKVLSLIDIVSGHIETNMEIWESLRLLDIAKSVDQADIKQVVLSSEAEGLLVVDTNEDGAYLLRPRLGATNFDDIQYAALKLLDITPLLADARTIAPEKTTTAPTPPIEQQTNTTTKTDSKTIRVSVLNGTTYSGLAATTAGKIRSLGYAVVNIGNAPRQNYERTVLYTVSADSNTLQDALTRIRGELGANVATTVPVFVESDSYDIVVILGNDAIPQ